jgi:DNA-directed RNA polymerase
LKWLYVDLANNLGLDKFGLARRVEIGRGIYNKELSYKKLGGDLDSLEMARLTRDKIDEAKVGNKVNAMVYLDASNQAVQLYAIINRSKQLAKVSNMLDNAELIDAYQMLADYLNEEYGTDRYTRKLCKKALMITLYGSQNGHMEIINTVEEQGKLAEFEADFNAEEPTFQKVVQSAIADLVPEAVETMGDILEINQRLLKPVYTWTLPDGFHVITRIRRKEELVVDIPLDIQDENAEKERYTIVTKKWGASKYSAALAPNIIHSIDGYLARMVILRFKKLGKFITTTHDAYGVHPNDCDLLVQVYKEELWRIAEDRVFENILSQIVGEEVTIDNLGDLTFDDIKDSVNMLS